MNGLPEGVVRLGRKEYHTVAKRVNDFREAHGNDYGITTEIVTNNDLVTIRAVITARKDGFVIATGTAEEKRGSSQVNRTSALENCETSAIGRALAAFGIGGTEFASANEVQNAVHQQQEGQSQGDDQGEVSPPAPKGWREPDSTLSTPSKLAAEMRRLERELAGCGDSEMVYALTSTVEWNEFAKIARKHAPHYLSGGEPAPEEFEGLQATAERLVREFDAADANERVAMVSAG